MSLMQLGRVMTRDSGFADGCEGRASVRRSTQNERMTPGAACRRGVGLIYESVTSPSRRAADSWSRRFRNLPSMPLPDCLRQPFLLFLRGGCTAVLTSA